MKLIFLTVVSVAVFRANCLEHPGGRELSDDDRNLSDGRDLPDDRDISDGRDQSYGSDLSDGPSNEASTIEPEPFPGGPVDPDFSTDVDGGITFAEVGPGHVQGGFENYESSDVEHQLKEDGRVQNEHKLQVPMEVKLHDLETKLRAMVVNLTSENSNLYTEMNSDTIMNSLISNLTITNAKMTDFMTSSITNLTIANSDMKNELQFIKENMTNALTKQESKLHSIREKQGCPEGLFLFAPSNQCFQLLNDTTRNWDTANAACRAKGLVLAQPYDPVAIRSYIVTKYGDFQYTWIGARGIGSYVKFQRSSRYIGASNPLWYSRNPSTSYCLALNTLASMWKSYGDRVYYSIVCTSGYWALCELVTE